LSAVQSAREGLTLNIVTNFPISKKAQFVLLPFLFTYKYAMSCNIFDYCMPYFFPGWPKASTQAGIVLQFMLLMGNNQLKPRRSDLKLISKTHTRVSVYVQNVWRKKRVSNLPQSWKSSLATVDPTDIDIDPL